MARKIIEADALDWLSDNRDVGSVITSLPDMEETGHSNHETYEMWFSHAVQECFLSTSKAHPTIFYQTDRLINGRRLSKAYLLMDTAVANERELVWHKIVLRHDVGKTDIRRPGYSHLLCFGDSKVKPGRPTADVIRTGGVLYPDGMGITAAKVALQAAIRHGTALCDPFCGRGTVCALAEQTGFEKIIGVDIDPKQVAAAKALRLMVAEGGHHYAS
jgi:hypothetical protein